MPVELEAKMKLVDATDRDTIAQRLLTADASPIGTFFERNLFFDTPARTLLAADSGLRLRIADVEGAAQPMQVLTFKGPRQAGQLKSREEVELSVADATAAIALLNALGYRQYLMFEKRRRSWSVYPCRVELDEIPHLGHFAEIEGPDEAAILTVRHTLGLADRPLIRQGYVGLLVDHLRQRGQSTTEITFDRPE
jgi:adenylate cyclase class 2